MKTNRASANGSSALGTVWGGIIPLGRFSRSSLFPLPSVLPNNILYSLVQPWQLLFSIRLNTTSVLPRTRSILQTPLSSPLSQV